MILSALLTSVGINLSLCLVFFTLYSILRKQPGNLTVYSPRLVAQGESQDEQHFTLERLLPTASWVKRAWDLSEDEILSVLGFDAMVFIRIFVFCLKVFSIAGIIGIFVLLPINYTGTQLSDDSDLPNKSLESFSISNVNDGSNRLWAHFCAIYVLTGFVCYLLHQEHSYIVSKRISFFYSSKPQPHQFTILVRGIPVSSDRRSCREQVESFFAECYPSTYLSSAVIHHSSKLQDLKDEARKLYRRLPLLKKKNETQQQITRDGFLGIFGSKVDTLEHYEKKLEGIEANVRAEQSLGGKEVRAAFVSFKSRFGAGAALHMQQGVNPTEWVTERAPEPRDVHWPFFLTSFLKRWISKLVVVVACAALTILFLIPVVLVQGLANLDQLETWFPFLIDILTLPVISQVVTGYLPSLILQLFLSIVPPIMILLSSMQGYISLSQIEKSACTKVLWFTIWNIFFANVLSGSALYQVSVFLEPKKIPGILAEAVPAQASFFIAYIVTSGWTSLSSELFRMIPLICNCVKKIFLGNLVDEIEVPSVSYHSEIPKVLFFGLLGITYFFLAPLILPFLLVYYCLGYIIYRNQLLNVYSAKYETGGKSWPIVHYSTIFSLILMHVIAIGIFGLKELPLASTLIIPLPILTLLFHDYCRKRFLPLFKLYPAECLIKKDRQDEKDPNMGEFYEKLVAAYRDPALMPITYPGSTTDHESHNTTPLLHDARVSS